MTDSTSTSAPAGLTFRAEVALHQHPQLTTVALGFTGPAIVAEVDLRQSTAYLTVLRVQAGGLESTADIASFAAVLSETLNTLPGVVRAPVEPTEAQAAAFREAWLEADAAGQDGRRVIAGLRAALNA